MFKDQLLLAIVLQKHGILVKGTDLSSELDAADQIDRDGCFVFADRVQKRVLYILCRLVFHLPISCLQLGGVGRNEIKRHDASHRARHRKPRNRRFPQWLNNIELYQPFQPRIHSIFMEACSSG